MRPANIALGLIICSTLITNANGQDTARGVDRAVETTIPSLDSSAPDNNDKGFNPSGIDKSVVNEFGRAWQCSGLGTGATEGLVLIYRKPGGSYLAISQGCSSQFGRFAFRWTQNIIAIVHTHRNLDDPKPSQQDELVADKFGVPVSTITRRGMFTYDPSTRKTSKVMNGLDWLEAGKFRERTGTPVLSKTHNTTSTTINKRRTS